MKIEHLIAAIGQLDASDALRTSLNRADWQSMASFMSVRFLREGDTLVKQGDTDRDLFIVVEGQLQVLVGTHPIATLTAGKVVGEGAFFSAQARSATVLATGPAVVWCLTIDRFEILCEKHPRIALDFTRALASMLAVRMREAILIEHFSP
jgi:CRP/FNR family transcriptional regulator, cyclic AMP receptor protein